MSQCLGRSGDACARTRLPNHAGKAALALRGRTTRTPTPALVAASAIIESVIFPNELATFDAGPNLTVAGQWLAASLWPDRTGRWRAACLTHISVPQNHTPAITASISANVLAISWV